MASAFRVRSRANSRSSSPGIEEETQELQGDNYLRELTNPVESNIDIVAVHGLNPGKENHGEKTWMKNGVLWLRDEGFLPQRFPTARVLLFGYNSKVAFSTSIAGVMDVAIALLNRLISRRTECPERPIVFLCHSLGGIIVKQALVRAVHGRTYNNIRLATRGICFFGTPHRGGNGADLGSVLASIMNLLTGGAKNNFMKTLQKDSTIAADIHELFKEQILDYQIVSFYETLPFKPGVGLIVDKISATIGFPDSNELVVPIARNHSDICKFDRRDDTFQLVIDNVANVIQHALQPQRTGAPLLTPMISVEDPENRRRTLSAPSEQSNGVVDLLGLEDEYSTTSSNLFAYSNPGESFDIASRHRITSPRTSASPRRRIVMLPYSSNPDFIGRDKVLKSVKQALAPGSLDHRRISLYGLGGVGKSQVAIHYAYWYRREFPDHSIFWVHCGTADRFRQGLLDIAVECKIPGVADPNNNRLLLLKDWLARRTDLRWLMILDNADDPSIFRDVNNDQNQNQSALDLSQYIPDCEQGSILITTRDLSVGRRLANGRPPIQIHKMSRTESVMMLKTRLGGRDPFSPVTPATPKSYAQPVNDEDLGQLANVLGDLPLAMVQAAAFITENSISVQRYLHLFEDDSSAVQLLKHNFEENGRDLDVPNSVYGTWKLSIEQIQRDNSKSAELIFLMAHYEQLQIPVSLLKSYIGGSPVEYTTIVGVLLRFSLISSGSNDTYSMHRLVQLIVKQWLAASNTSVKWQSTALRLLAEAFPNGEFETWSICASLDAHAVKMIQTPSTNDDDKQYLARLQSNLSWYYSLRGRWSSAEECSRAANITYQEIYGTRNKETLTAMTKFAMILKQNGKFEEAEIVAKRATDESKSFLGSKDQTYLDALEAYGLVVVVLGKLDAAEKACRRVLAGREKLLGPHHPDIFSSTRRLASVLEHSGRYGEAEVFIRKALNGQKHLIGTADKSTLQTTYKLATILRAQGKYKEAEETGRQNLETHKTTYGSNHLETQVSRYSYAITLSLLGRVDEAEKIIVGLINFVEIERPFDENHPYNFHLQFELGHIRTRQNRYKEAMHLYRQALVGMENVHKEHPETYEYRSAYAAALFRADPTGGLEESIQLQRQANDELSKTLGNRHPLTLTSSFRLSEALAQKKQISKAMQLAKQVGKERERALGSSHPDTIEAKNWIVELGKRKDQSSTGEDLTIDKLETPSSGKVNKKRRSFLGLRSRASSSVDKEDITTTDEKQHSSVTSKDVDRFEDDGPRARRSSILGLLGLSMLERKGSENEKDLDLDTEDDSPLDNLDPEKTPAFTTSSNNKNEMPKPHVIEPSQRRSIYQDMPSTSQGLTVKPTQEPLWGQLDPQEAAIVASNHKIKRRPVNTTRNGNPNHVSGETSEGRAELS